MGQRPDEIGRRDPLGADEAGVHGRGVHVPAEQVQAQARQEHREPCLAGAVRRRLRDRPERGILVASLLKELS